MENFNLLDGSDTLKASRDTINNNLLSVRSLSSGAAFPTDNLSVGMLCYRTDLKRIYQYQENGSWSADIAMNINGNANTANSAGTAATANRATVADSCTGNSATATTAETCTGNSATATKLKSAISINNVAFDGTKNINIPVGVKTVNGIEPDANGDVVVAGLPIGHEWWTANPNIPVGCLPLFGGTFSREAYKDLWAWVQTQGSYLISEAEWQEKATANDGNVSFYSDGDGSTTFRVPAIFCWAKGANNAEEVGSYLSDMFGSHRHSAVKPSGATVDDTWCFQTVRNLSSTSTSRQLFKADSTGTQYVISANKNADDYGSVDDISYNNNTTYTGGEETRPKSVVGMWLVKAFGTVSNVGNQDIADISAGLTRVEEKMDEYTDNVAYIDSFIVESWVSDDGLSWYRKYNDGYIEQAGDAQGTAKNEKKTITLPTAFTTTNYCVVGTLHGSGWNNDNGSFQVSDKTTTSFLATSSDAGAYYLGTWYACGY